MSSTLNNVSSPSEITTSAGHIVTFSVPYSASQRNGVWVLVAAAGISGLAVFVLLIALSISGYKTLRTPRDHRYMRTHVVAYFISLLICDIISAVGSLMTAHWISRGGVFLDGFCTAQGALKNTGNVGTALWTMVITIHTFCLLVLRWRLHDYVFYATLLVGWLFVGSVSLIGQSAVQEMKSRGPYFGISGYWCWITDGYGVERVTLEYLWMFLSALTALLLYTMVFLSLRGNLVVSGGTLHLRFIHPTSVWEDQTSRDSHDAHVMSLAKQMLVYPIAYTTLVLPIAICRFLEWAGHTIPFGATIFADGVFLLSGLVNAALFTATRKIVPFRKERGLFSRSASSGRDFESKRSMRPLIASPIATEKALMSPVSAESGVLVEPVSLPVAAIQGSRANTRPVVAPARTLSRDPSLYSQTSARDSIDSLSSTVKPMYQPESHRVVNRQLTITPLDVTKMHARRKMPVDIPAAVTEGPEVYVSEANSDLFYSTSPNGIVRPLPRIPTAAAQPLSRNPCLHDLQQLGTWNPILRLNPSWFI
ncbi:hypothetical protein JB92DRAFT_178977 [Gautieria morchelliformis]|nr:hypothetical protein JB92DRAFT_178977 [Gautieria morchelliformis]